MMGKRTSLNAIRLRRLGVILVIAFGLLTTLASGGGGGDGGSNTPPTISNLVLSRDSARLMENGGRTTIQTLFDYADPEADLVSIRIEISEGSSLTVPISGPLPGPSGGIGGVLEFATDAGGIYTAEVWVIDSAGNSSNRLTATFTVFGSSALSALELSGVTLDRPFSPAVIEYSAEVDLSVISTNVTASAEDRGATLLLNGEPADSGALVPVDLAIGGNVISVQVTRADTGEQRTYTINIRRGESSLLSNLTISASTLDQIFQPNMTDYTASAQFSITMTTVTATVEDPNATLTVDGVPTPSGVASNPIALVEGSNVIAIVVSAADGGASSTYTLEVTRKPVAAFSHVAYMKASNTDASDFFGTDVTMDGDTLVVGAPGESSIATGINGDQQSGGANSAGAAYVFVRDASGMWAHQAYVKASNTDASDAFGSAVSFNGDTLAVAAYGEDSIAAGVNGEQANNGANRVGAVYIFVRDELDVWAQQAYIKSSNPELNDRFGAALDLDGDTLVVGAIEEDSSAIGIDGDQTNNSARNSGAAYVFTRDASGMWSQQAYLKASNTSADDSFGRSVALAGDTLVVGATGEDSGAAGVDGDAQDDSVSGSGAAYVFRRSPSGMWVQQAYLKASNPGAGDQFGSAIALDGDTLVVSAINEDSAGAAYVFTRDAGGVWSQQAYLKASQTGVGDRFGASLALDGSTLIVGATHEDSSAIGVDGDDRDNSLMDSGAAYVFARDAGGSWSQQAYIKASNTDERDRFGVSVAVVGSTVAIGADREESSAQGIGGDQSDNGVFNAGAVYVLQ